MTTCGSICSGCGGWEVGAISAGVEPKWAIEIDPDIAGVYAMNIGGHVHIGDVRQMDPFDFEPVDILFASPPCQAYSVARNKSLPTRDDADVGKWVGRFTAVLKPRVVMVENVPAYRDSEVFKGICDVLADCGYWLHWQLINSADLGVPQTRRRLILRAVRGGMVPALPQPVPWRGWYEAIEDLIPSLPDSEFAPWQLKRLPELVQSSLVGSNQAQFNQDGIVVRGADAPSVTVTESSSRLRGFILDGQYSGEPDDQNSRAATRRNADEPVFTITSSSNKRSLRAFIMHGMGSGRKWGAGARMQEEPFFTVTGWQHGAHRAAVNGRVVKITPRALARFQSFPDSFVLPGRDDLACKVIGNAVPPLMAQRLIEGVI